MENQQLIFEKNSFLEKELAKKNRELEIEAALEKVRSHSLAMHKSIELKNVVVVVFEKFKELHLKFDVAGIQLFKEGSRDIVQWVAAPGLVMSPVLANLPYIEKDHKESKIIRDIWAAKEEGKKIYNKQYSFNEKNKFFEYAGRNNDFKTIPEEARKFQLKAPGYTYTLISNKHSGLWLDSYSGQTISIDEYNILERFARVFEQAYVRFLDLQKAEAQAREAQIEAALESVRASSMAMHYSNELENVVKTLATKFTELGLSLDGALIFFFDKKTRDISLWIATNQLPDPIKVEIPNSKTIQSNLIVQDLWAAFETGKGFINRSYSGKIKNDYFHFTVKNNRSKIPKPIRKFQQEAKSWTFSAIAGKNSLLGIDSWHEKFITEQDYQVLIRFSNAFEQAYTRFLDLQKAEAQAREAQIEAALEKIRSRSLAMQKSDELKEVVAVLFVKLKELGLVFDGGAGIILFTENSRNAVIGVLSPELGIPTFHDLPYDEKSFMDNPIAQDVWRAKDEGVSVINKIYSFDQKNRYFEYVFKHNDESKLPKSVREFIFNTKSYTATFIAEKNSFPIVNSWTEQLLSEENIAVLRRVARVFEQAYIRFLDLQKAEAQAREAQIEAALEKVRSRSLAMHHSNELEQVVATLFDHLVGLGLAFDGALILVFDKKKQNIELWIATVQLPKPVKIDLPFDEEIANNTIIKDLWNAVEKGEHIFNRSYSGQTKNEYFRYVIKYNESKIPNPVRQIELESESWTASFVAEKNSIIGFDSWSGPITSITAEDFQVLKRFARVFEQAYTRFLDLQKAEAQAREAQIEASMERLRAKAMAMQTSAALNGLVQTMYAELKKLDESLNRCFIMIFDPQTRDVTWWMADDYNDQTNQAYLVPYSEHPPQLAYLKGWEQRQEKWQYIIQGKEKKAWDEYLFTLTELAHLPAMVIQGMRSFEKIYLCASFSNFGCVTTGSEQPLSESAFDILVRFAKVFDLTYTRFNDLKRAEANTREAIKQSALDRIRADIASMRTVSDLDRITPLIWNELTILGVPFIRCGVFIMDDEKELSHAFLSTPDGKAIAAFQVPYNTQGKIGLIPKNWKSKTAYIDYWTDVDFDDFANTLKQQQVISASEQYLSGIPHKGLYLHCVPFLQGMLYVGNTNQLNEDEVNLIQSVADAFSTAYSRYEDFNKLEAAKKQVDSALNELQSTQRQLIQSEKMASLGELTAGIAHEIQNPLNFVNNFSDVNKELIEELNAERLKPEAERDEQLENEILNDIKENEEKINHHGKRADAIVKGMLQHSRASTGKKETTDINALCDEYLRLSYHGMRAKDKNFNANFKTDLDSSIPKINIVPQDIGRVLLNLFNNAFYACAQRSRSSVNEQKSKNLISYEPKVSVATRRSGNRVYITVRDNGNGIPQKIIDKIFQPFFTTKPTGEGTGLGLSLSYDIVKAHGGEIKVVSKEGEGSEFVIQLANTNI